MSLVGTLGRIAVGIAVAKGVGKMVNNGGAGGGGGLGGMLGSALGGGQSSGGGLGGMLGSALGGGQSSGGGLGGLLGAALGGMAKGGQGSSGGGLGDLGALLGGKSGGGMAGGLGGLLESISGGMGGGAAASNANANIAPPAGGSLGDLLNSALQGKKIPEPEPAQEDQARILIQAMVNAAKSDGEIDKEEQQKIVANLGDDVSDEERQFVINEMKSPLDIEGFIRSIPRGAEMQVYMMSLLGIDLDSREEAQYLDTLRTKIGMSEEQCNAVHQKLGVPALYS